MRARTGDDGAKRDGPRWPASIVGLALLVLGLGIATVRPGDAGSLLAGAIAGAGTAVLAGLLARRTIAPPAPAPLAPAAAATGIDAILNAIDDPLLLVDGRSVAAANRAAGALLGEHVVDEDVRLAIRHPAAAELIAPQSSEGGTVELAGLGGRDRHWEMTVRPLGPGRRLVRLTDRSAGRAAERMRVDFVANASHELRTPLASLIGFVETLEDANGPGDEAVRLRFLTIMRGEARRMQRLVDDLISLSRIEADRHRAPADAVSLAGLVTEAADALGDPRIEIAAAAGLPAVAGDRAQLSQLVHNLVGNALKYGDPARPVRVSIGAGRGGMIRLEVADEGEGIAPEHLPRLTERFYRVDPGRSRAGGGTGLGLAIVKHIVERHRGRLDIASRTGKGTRVTVLLPAVRD